MRKFYSSVMLFAAAAMAFASCAKDLTSDSAEKVDDQKIEKKAGNVTINFTATLTDDTRASIAADGKMAWEATDAIGLVVKGTEATDINLKAITAESLCGDGRFFTEGGTVAEGTVYAYYPWVKFNETDVAENTKGGVLQLSEKSMWSVVAQYQVQSAANVNEAGRYMTMAAEGVTLTEGSKPTLAFTALGSVLCLDIYDTTGKYTSENVESVIAVAEGAADETLVGGFKYDLVNKAFDYTSSGVRKAAKTDLTTPFAVPAAAGAGKVYMAILPGAHTFKVTVNTDCGVHVFKLTSSQTSTVGKIGTIKLNLGNTNVEHFVQFFPFDLMAYGSDLMYTNTNGWCPHESTSVGGNPCTPTDTGEEPYCFQNTANSVDGSNSFGSFAEAENNQFLHSRDVQGWTAERVYEHPGYIKCGSASAGYSFTLPALRGVNPNGETLQLSFDVARRHATTTATRVSVIGGGNIDGQDYVDINPTTPASAAAVKDNVEHFTFYLYNATNETQVVIGSAASNSATRTHFDNIKVERVSSAPLASVVPTKSATSGNATISWEAVANASSYNYSVFEGEDTTAIASSSTTETSISFSITNDKSYRVEIQAISSNPVFTPSEVSTVYVAYCTLAAGTELFNDDFSWMHTMWNDTYKATWSATAKWEEGSTTEFRVDNWTVANMTEEGYATANTLYHYYTDTPRLYVYGRYGYIKFGRAYNSGKCFGALELNNATLLKDVAKGAVVKVKVTGTTKQYGTSENRLSIVTKDADGTDARQDFTDIPAENTDISVTIDKFDYTSKAQFQTFEYVSGKAARVYLYNIKAEIVE